MSALHPRLLARLGLLFDRRVRIEGQVTGFNATGQKTGGYGPVPGFENIEAQRTSLPGEEITLPGGAVAVARYVWVLKGAFNINLSQQLAELDTTTGQPTGVVHAIYQADIDALGLTTLKTAQVKR